MDNDELFIDAHKLPKALSKQEIYDLFEKMYNGDEQAKSKLVLHNIRLVIHQVVKRFNTVNYDKKELVSVGNLGLMKAINSFDTSKDLEFATYAVRCIDNEILYFLRKLKKADAVLSLDDVVYYDQKGNDIKLEDTIMDDTDFIEEYAENETHRLIRQIIKNLPGRDREIVMLHFGFYNNKVYTQDEIANKLSLSQSYVSRLLKKILDQLGEILEQNGLIELGAKQILVDKNESNKKEENATTEIKEDSKSSNEFNKKKQSKYGRKIKTFYEFFNLYTKEQVDTVVENLFEDEKLLISLRYGDDLNNPIQISGKLNRNDTNRFYGALIPKIRRLLDNKYNNKNKTIYKYFDSYTKEQIDSVLDKLPEKDKALISLRYGEDLNNPVLGKLSKEETRRFYGVLITKIRRLLDKLDSDKKIKKIKTIYEHFDSYTKEQIDSVIDKLPEKDKALISLRYGEDLNNPIPGKLSKKETNRFYNIIRKMKGMLVNLNKEIISEKNEGQKIENNKNDLVECSANKIMFLDVEDKKDNELKTLDEEHSNEFDKIAKKDDVRILPEKGIDEVMTKEDYFKMLEMIKTPFFTKMLGMLTAKEAIIVSLKFGYIDGKYFSNSAISEFLGIEQNEVIDTTIKFLLAYKESMNKIIDEATQVLTDDSEIIIHSQIKKLIK